MAQSLPILNHFYVEKMLSDFCSSLVNCHSPKKVISDNLSCVLVAVINKKFFKVLTPVLSLMSQIIFGFAPYTLLFT
jgi:hypothetical protein